MRLQVIMVWVHFLNNSLTNIRTLQESTHNCGNVLKLMLDNKKSWFAMFPISVILPSSTLSLSIVAGRLRRLSRPIQISIMSDARIRFPIDGRHLYCYECNFICCLKVLLIGNKVSRLCYNKCQGIRIVAVL